MTSNSTEPIANTTAAANSSSFSNESSSLTTNGTLTAWDVYLQYGQNCDSPDKQDAALASSAYTFFAVYGIGVVLQLCILPVNSRLSKHRSAFLLLLHINALEILWLLQYTLLSAEFLIGSRVHVPLSLDAYLFRVVNFCIDWIFIQLSFNRACAVLFPLVYGVVFSLKMTKRLLLGTWLVGIVYAVYANWFPVRRPFPCLMQLGYYEPTTSIPKNLLAVLPDTALYNGIQQVYMVCIYIPMLLYIVTFAKMVYEFAERKMATSIEEPVTSLHQSNAEREENANLLDEKSRTFFICFLSTLSYFLANSLYEFSRIVELSDHTVQVMAVFWQLFGMVFHVQQPLLMFLLSKDFRRGLQDDVSHLLAKIKAVAIGGR